MTQRKLWQVDPDNEDIFKEALYLFSHDVPLTSRFLVTPLTWFEYEYYIRERRVTVLLRGEWWKKKCDPLGLNSILVGIEYNAMLNIEIKYQCATHIAVYLHKRAQEYLNAGWERE